MPAKKKPAKQRRTKALNPDATTQNIPCLKSEKTAWQKEAGKADKHVAKWLRDLANKAAGYTPPDAPPKTAD